MSAELVVARGQSELAIEPGQNAWSAKQVAALHQLGVKDASAGDLAVFFHQCSRTGLDPFARQIYLIGRKTKENDRWITKQTIQTGIDGYRLIARRAADSRHETLEYEETLWCGENGQWVELWMQQRPPAAAKVTVLRNGSRFPAVAMWRESVQTTRDSTVNTFWTRMPAGQLEKVAEAKALRKAFPQDLSGVLVEDEMPEPEQEPTTTVTREPTRLVARAVRRTPVVEPVEPPLDDPTPEPQPTFTTAEGRTIQTLPPEPDAEPEPIDVSDLEAVELITPQQLKLLHVLLGKQGYGSRNDGLAYLTMLLDHEVTTSKDLTKNEASTAIDALQRLADPS